MAKAKYAACLSHRAHAQSVVGITEKQEAGLRLGRAKGTNHRTGYKHREESKRKASLSHKRFCAQNPDRVAARGTKIRAEKHYRWNGGITALNKSLRAMTENRRWMDSIKERDGFRCARCGSRDKIESHHIKYLRELIAELGIESRDDARKHAGRLWDLSNGETLCEVCHYAEHGRRLAT
jgi:5-methylcytosine-specific restriction endonuclease McrA